MVVTLDLMGRKVILPGEGSDAQGLSAGAGFVVGDQGLSSSGADGAGGEAGSSSTGNVGQSSTSGGTAAATAGAGAGVGPQEVGSKMQACLGFVG